MWAYVVDSIEEPATASDGELMALSRTLSHFYVTWNSTQQVILIAIVTVTVHSTSTCVCSGHGSVGGIIAGGQS